MVTGVSIASVAKLGKGENITTGILIKICEGRECDLTILWNLLRKSIHDKRSTKYWTINLID